MPLALIVLVVTFLAFTLKKSSAIVPKNTIGNIDVIKILEEQKMTCRSELHYSFYMETELLNKSRGANIVSVKTFIYDRFSKKSKMITDEKVIVPKYPDTKFLSKEGCYFNSENGDEIVQSKLNYSLKNLLKFEIIKNIYVKSTNELLGLNRVI